MQKLRSLLFTILISISIITVARETMAQTSAAPSKAGTSHHARHISWSVVASGAGAIVQSLNRQRDTLCH
jgi:hypothetical protein